jgi:predicted DNA-binding mobile mystery protein A
MKNASLRRMQLDRFFDDAKKVSKKMPSAGWVKEIRESLGMSMQDLASRLGVIKQRVEKIEKDEIAGKLTLETLKKTADGLNCEFVYFLIPKKSLEETLKDQALMAAKAITKEVEHTMKLEAQGTSTKAQKQLIENLAQEMLIKQDRRIWRKK